MRHRVDPFKSIRPKPNRESASQRLHVRPKTGASVRIGSTACTGSLKDVQSDAQREIHGLTVSNC